MTKRYWTTKRYAIGDNIAIVDNESLTPNGIPKNIFVAQDPVEAIKICKELNKQDQQIKELKKENKEMNEQLNSIFNLIDDEMELCKKQYEDAPPEKEKILRERYSIADAIKEIMVKNKKY